MPRTFLNNQVAQVYVLKTSPVTALPTDAATGDKTVSSLAEGAVVALTTLDDLFFVHKGKGGVTRSDLIKKDSILKVTAGNEDSGMVLHKATVGFNAGALEGATPAPVVGEAYTLRVEVPGVYGSADDSKLIVMATTMAVKGDTPAALMARLAANLQKNLKKHDALLTCEYTATQTYLTLQEAVPEWIPEIKQQVTHPIYVYPSIISDSNANELYWADVVYENEVFVGGATETAGNVGISEYTGTAAPTFAPKVLGNATALADMEWYYMGERADKYRKVGYPKYVPTKYMLDGTTNGCTLCIHYAFTDSNEASYKSEKDIVFIGSRTNINTLVTAINNLTGKTYSTPAPTQFAIA